MITSLFDKMYVLQTMYNHSHVSLSFIHTSHVYIPFEGGQNVTSRFWFGFCETDSLVSLFCLPLYSQFFTKIAFVDVELIS